MKSFLGSVFEDIARGLWYVVRHPVQAVKQFVVNVGHALDEIGRP